MPKKPREKTRAVITDPDGQVRRIQVVGRFAQTLRALVEAGEQGVTALEISSWALRLGHYIFILRHRYGLNISMELEPHEGAYSGRHGRYRLRSNVRFLESDQEAGSAGAFRETPP